MKKIFKYYLAIWTIFLILFNIISFVFVGWMGTVKYTPSFWFGYVFIIISFIGQLVCAHFAFKEDVLNKMFYNVSLIIASYIGLILSFIIGGLCMIIPLIPYWVAVILCSIVLAFNIVAVIKASVSINVVSEIDSKVEEKILFINTLTVDAKNLFAHAKNENIKAECKKIYEAVRYSDPISDEVLVSVENEINLAFSKLSDAVTSEDLKTVTKLTDELITLITIRNNKCKSIKRSG